MPTYSPRALPDLPNRGQTYKRHRLFTTFRTAPEQAPDQRLTGAGVGSAANWPWRFDVGWHFLSTAEAMSLWHAALFVGGEVQSIFFFEWQTLVHTNVYIGVGDGTANPITLPVKGASSGTTVVRVNGTPVFPAGGTFSAGTGADGEDRIADVLWTNGGIIRADFTGRRRRAVVIEGDFAMEITPDSQPRRWTAGVRLLETRGTDQL